MEITVSFPTFKALTALRPDEATTYDDVIRKLLGLEVASHKSTVATDRAPWVYKGVEFPHGTEFRAVYKGRSFTAHIEDGKWIQNGVQRGSPSEAAHAITSTNINGWNFWQARLPGESHWRDLKSFRRH
jgi:hypothetical protein